MTRKAVPVGTGFTLFLSGVVSGALAVVFATWYLSPALDPILGSSKPARPADDRPVIDARKTTGSPQLDDAGHAALDGVDSKPRRSSGEVIGPSTTPPAELKDRNLEFPVQGGDRRQLLDTFRETRGNRLHEAVDILAPRDTPVVAVEGGKIARLFQSRFGGITVYQFDRGEEYCYYYAHLARYAAGLREGQFVRRGEVIGYVGTSGNAPPNTPHLHFAIFRLTDEKKWWVGSPIDPYPLLKD